MNDFNVTDIKTYVIKYRFRIPNRLHKYLKSWITDGSRPARQELIRNDIYSSDVYVTIVTLSVSLR